VVDDDRRVRELLEVTLTTQGFAVLTAADGEEALMRARRERPDLILLDVRLPKRSGLEVCDVLRNDPTDPAVPIILITAASETEHRLQGLVMDEASEAIRHGVVLESALTALPVAATVSNPHDDYRRNLLLGNEIIGRDEQPGVLSIVASDEERNLGHPYQLRSDISWHFW